MYDMQNDMFSDIHKQMMVHIENRFWFSLDRYSLYCNTWFYEEKTNDTLL